MTKAPMAGDPAFCELLLAMGLRSFSMHPSQIAAIKQQVINTDALLWSARLERVLEADEPERICGLEKMAIEQSRAAFSHVASGQKAFTPAAQ